MAGATLSSSLPSRFVVKLENGDTSGLDIGTDIREEKLTVDDAGVLACPHCSFSTTSLSELKSHRWEVHPLLAKRKGHLMCASPKNSRKRPNSESSEDGKLTDPDEGAPKKKPSPRHSPLASDETTLPYNGASFRPNARSCSTDEMMVINCNLTTATSEKQAGVGNFSPLNLTTQSKSPNFFAVDSSKFSSSSNIDKFDCNSRRSASESPNSDSGCVPSPPSPTAYDETCDLHTLAKAALNASPIPQPHSVSFYENKSLFVPPSMGYHLQPYPFVVGSSFGSSYPLPFMNNFYYHSYPPSEERFDRGKNLANEATKESSSTTACFPPQAPFASHRIPPPAVPTLVSNNFISSTTTHVNPALFHPNSVANSQTTFPTRSNSDNKLTALSQIATDRLSSSASFVHKDLEISSKPFFSYQHENMEILNQKKQGAVSSNMANFNKPDAHQRQLEKKLIMDDDRVKSLEEALSKIDCCDPQERSNALPYRCPDGKWRMVQAKCVGGAWLIQVPGAPHPSVYVPFQKKSPSYGTLDDWLKARLTSTNRSFQHKSDPKQTNRSPIKQYSQSEVGGQYLAAVNTKRPCGFFHSGANQPVQSGAIKSLLLQKSTLS